MARFPDQTKRGATSGGLSDGHYFYYAKTGFGEKPGMDHTKPSSRQALFALHFNPDLLLLLLLCLVVSCSLPLPESVENASVSPPSTHAC